MSKPTDIELAVVKATHVDDWNQYGIRSSANVLRTVRRNIAAHTAALKANGLVIVPTELIEGIATGVKDVCLDGGFPSDEACYELVKQMIEAYKAEQ